MTDIEKIVVTGAGGFLGGYLIQALVSRRVSVVAVSSKPIEKLFAVGNLKGSSHEGLKAVRSNDIEALRWALAGADVLVNCAFPRNVDGAETAKGLKFIADLFFLAEECGVGSVVNISSQSVYSQYRESAATEETPLCLESQYAVGKYASELLLEACCSRMPHTNIRLSSLIGPGFDQRVVNKMVKAALRAGVVSVRGGNQKFDYMDVRDAADAIAAIVESDSGRWRPVYNLSSDHPATLSEIAETVSFVLASLDVECCVEKLSQDGVSSCSAVDSALFRKDFSWMPKYSLTDSVTAIAHYELQKKNSDRGTIL